jgi:hypothetical protein
MPSRGLAGLFRRASAAGWRVGRVCVWARAWRRSPRACPQPGAVLALVLALSLGPLRVRAPARSPETDAAESPFGLQGEAASESADDGRARCRERLAEWRRRAAGGDGMEVGGARDNRNLEMAPLNRRCVSPRVMLDPFRPPT